MEDLLKEFKSGNEKAFIKIMNIYKEEVFRYMYLLSGNRETAEELTQETFVKVYFKAKTLKTDNLKGWIFAIARNIARKEYNKRKLKKIFPLSDIKNLKKASFDEISSDKILINELLKEIPEKYKTPLLMKEIEGLTIENISKILKKPIGTIKSYIFRGKSLLKDRYKTMMEVKK